MRIFITGTDTNVGKTVISSWLALHLNYSYFKPIQTGIIEGSDSEEVARLAKVKVYPEIYRYSEPVSPHLAAKLAGDVIEIEKINLPNDENLIIEGTGGVMVPINDHTFMIDLIQKLGAKVILVARSKLGTINHTILSLEAMRLRGINILGVIMNGEENRDNKEAIEFYGKTRVLAQFPKLGIINNSTLSSIILNKEILQILCLK